MSKSKRQPTKSKAYKESLANFRAYKTNLRDQKKQVPARLRASINWSAVPDIYLGNSKW